MSGQSGFTLMEVLVAMSVTAAVLTGAFLSFRTSMDLSRDLQVRQEASSMVRMTLRVIRDDLLSLCPSWGLKEQGASFYARDDGMPVFCTASTLDAKSSPDESRRRMVTYELRSGVLVRLESTPVMRESDALSTGKELVVELCDGVRSVVFSYAGDTGTAQHWWDSTQSFNATRDALPESINVTLQVQDEEGRPHEYSMSLRTEMVR